MTVDVIFAVSYAGTLLSLLIITQIWCWKPDLFKAILEKLKVFFYYRFYVNLHWFLDIKFQARLLRCCLSKGLDGYNFLSLLSFCVIPAAILIILVYGIWINNLIGLLNIIVFFSFFEGVFVLIILYLSIQFYKKNEVYLNGAQNKKYSPNKPHHGIFFVPYENQRLQLFMADSVDLLVRIFDEELPYKVYPINDEEDFEKAYANPNIRWLWIFGHGMRKHLAYFENSEVKILEYSTLSRQSNLVFIAQLHCNPGDGMSLPEVNGLTPDYDISHIRLPFQNRCYIMKKAKEFVDQESEEHQLT